MPYVKLDTKILDSSLWIEPTSRTIFITALLMARPLDLLEPTPTYQIRSTERDDFVIPPGEDYGFVAAAGSGIARRALVPVDEGVTALEQLAAPDTESRTPSFEGRRMVRINGGFIILNYKLHRDLDYSTERVRKHRDAKKREAASGTGETPFRNDVTEDETQADAAATPSARKKRLPKVQIAEEQWMAGIKANPAFSHINIDALYSKMMEWCSKKNETPSRRRFEVWLRKEGPALSLKPKQKLGCM